MGHDCTGRVIYITNEVRPIVDLMSELDFDVTKAECYTTPLPQPVKPAEYTMYIVIAFSEQYPMLNILPMPPRWTYYTHTDHTPVSVLIFAEQGKWRGIRAVRERIKASVNEFMSSIDVEGIAAVITLMHG